jgi:hypothetical protein
MQHHKKRISDDRSALVLVKPQLSDDRIYIILSCILLIRVIVTVLTILT